MEAYLKNMVIGCHYSWNKFGSDEDSLNDGLIEQRILLGFGALAMTASAVEVGSRKKEKAKGPSKSEKIVVGCYIRLGLGSQELCVYLGIERLRRGKPMN